MTARNYLINAETELESMSCDSIHPISFSDAYKLTFEECQLVSKAAIG
jgi:hypothetical protein